MCLDESSVLEALAFIGEIYSFNDLSLGEYAAGSQSTSSGMLILEHFY